MQRFKNILYVATPDVNNASALEGAITLANNNQARLTIVEVVEETPPGSLFPVGDISPADLQSMVINERWEELQKLVFALDTGTEIQTKILSGVLFLEVIHEVLRNERDLVIKVAQSENFLNRVFGSDDMHLLRKCPCPVWLLKADSPAPCRRIVAAVDINDFYTPEELNIRHQLNVQILEMAVSLALSELAELHVVNAWHAVGESAMRGALMARPENEITAYVDEARQYHERNLNLFLDEVTNKLGQDTLGYAQPQTHLLKGWARNEIPAFANKIKADIVIMGTVARIGIPGFIMGNTAETILNHIDCSVLAIKPQGFETPVSLPD